MTQTEKTKRNFDEIEVSVMPDKVDIRLHLGHRHARELLSESRWMLFMLIGLFIVLKIRLDFEGSSITEIMVLVALMFGGAAVATYITHFRSGKHLRLVGKNIEVYECSTFKPWHHRVTETGIYNISVETYYINKVGERARLFAHHIDDGHKALLLDGIYPDQAEEMTRILLTHLE